MKNTTLSSTWTRIWRVFLPASAEGIGDVWDFMAYLDRMAARWFQGHCRYGNPRCGKKYLTSLKLELEEYERTGNKESLINIAVWSYLEALKPEHREQTYDPAAPSVTRRFHSGQTNGGL